MYKLPSIRVFISYRRHDSAFITDRVCDRLTHSFGPECVFRDVASIGLGEDFRSAIDEALFGCTSLLAVIGPEWLGITDDRGRRRLFAADDVVRYEIASALDARLKVIPLVAQNAAMPGEPDLPEDIRGLARLNGIVVRPDPDFHIDMDRVIAALSGGSDEGRPPGPTAEKGRAGPPGATVSRKLLKRLRRSTADWYDEIVSTRTRVRNAATRAEADDHIYRYLNTRKYLPDVVAIRNLLAEEGGHDELLSAINAFLDVFTTTRGDSEARSRLCRPESVWSSTGIPGVGALGERFGLPFGDAGHRQDEELTPLQTALQGVAEAVARAELAL